MKLNIYQETSGKWAGRLIDDEGHEAAAISGCDSPEAVQEEARDSGFGHFTVTMLDQAP
jgi:hypothetical protein